jgi:hypothetical protein
VDRWWWWLKIRCTRRPVGMYSDEGGMNRVERHEWKVGSGERTGETGQPAPFFVAVSLAAWARAPTGPGSAWAPAWTLQELVGLILGGVTGAGWRAGPTTGRAGRRHSTARRGGDVAIRCWSLVTHRGFIGRKGLPTGGMWGLESYSCMAGVRRRKVIRGRAKITTSRLLAVDSSSPPPSPQPSKQKAKPEYARSAAPTILMIIYACMP